MELAFLRGRLILMKQQIEALFQRVMSPVKKSTAQSLERRLFVAIFRCVVRERLSAEVTYELRLKDKKIPAGKVPGRRNYSCARSIQEEWLTMLDGTRGLPGTARRPLWPKHQ